jgi:hypothetical protein
MVAAREVEARMRRGPEDEGNALVMIPVSDPGPAAPELLKDPLQGYPGVWRRESAPDTRPAQYIRVEDDHG